MTMRRDDNEHLRIDVALYYESECFLSSKLLDNGCPVLRPTLLK
jgi:hypothetical protein